MSVPTYLNHPFRHVHLGQLLHDEVMPTLRETLEEMPATLAAFGWKWVDRPDGIHMRVTKIRPDGSDGMWLDFRHIIAGSFYGVQASRLETGTALDYRLQMSTYRTDLHLYISDKHFILFRSDPQANTTSIQDSGYIGMIEVDQWIYPAHDMSPEYAMASKVGSETNPSPTDDYIWLNYGLTVQQNNQYAGPAFHALHGQAPGTGTSLTPPLMQEGVMCSAPVPVMTIGGGMHGVIPNAIIGREFVSFGVPVFPNPLYITIYDTPMTFLLIPRAHMYIRIA